MRGDLIETFKIMEFLIRENIFQHFSSNWKSTVNVYFQKLS